MESFRGHHLRDDHCFLCGEPLEDSNRTDEHVIPEWLQRRHHLWNQKLSLLNETTIPYRQLVIPCCSRCNTGALAHMEERVSRLLTGPFQAVNEDEEFLLFKWCSKILYGFLHKEMALRLDRRDGTSSPIVQRRFLDELSTFHHFMTSIRRPFEFVGFRPYSIFIVETLLMSNPLRNFDYFDSFWLGEPHNPTCLCRLPFEPTATE